MDAGTLFYVEKLTLLIISVSGASELNVQYALVRKSLGPMAGTIGSTIVDMNFSCLLGDAMYFNRI